MKGLVALVLLTCLAAENAFAEDSAANQFVARIMECSAGTKLETSSTELADAVQAYLGDGTLAGGAATVDVDNFLELFDKADRVAALKIYHDCLRDLYGRVDGTDTLVISEPSGSQVLSFPKPSVLLISEFLNRSQGQRSSFPLFFRQRCQMSVYATDRNQQIIEFSVRLQSKDALVGSASSDWGNNNSRGRIDVEVPPGKYDLVVEIARSNPVDAGFYELAVDTRSCM